VTFVPGPMMMVVEEAMSKSCLNEDLDWTLENLHLAIELLKIGICYQHFV